MKKILFSVLMIGFGWTVSAQQINEICPSNVSVYENEDEEFIDWIEIYNDTDDDLDLEGYSLTDDPTLPAKWVFPEIELDEGDLLVLNADEELNAEEAVTIPLGRKGGVLYLYNPSGILVDSVTRPELLPDHSYGRYDSEWYYFKNPTPNEENEGSTGYNGYASTPDINRLSGSYAAGTNIVIRPRNEDEDIYYSFNGTNPVTASLYTSPIVLTQTTSIRAVAVADSLIESAALYRTYFVGTEHKLPIVHLNLDSLELLDEIIGIYVLGPDAEEEYPHWGANFWKDIEIHAYFEYFDTDLRMIEALDCGVKIHGGTVSSTRPMKSLRLIAHNRYEKEAFTHQYFSNKPVKNFKRLILRNSGSDFNKTHLKDGVLHQFVLDHDIDVDAQGYEPVIVYINGHYWGIHNLREKLDKYYSASNYGVDPEGVNLLEEEELIVISGDSVEFTVIRDFVMENDMAIEANYNWVNDRLDLHSMVDYFIMELYVNNRDWPYNNLKLWNSPEQPRWRYFYSDLDAGIKYYGTEQEDLHSLAYILGPYGDNNVHVVIFKKMLDNVEFKRYFINRYADLLNTILQSDYLLEYIYRAKEKLSPEMQRHFYKWWGTLEQWNERFLAFDKFFADRVAIVLNELSVVFDKDDAVNIQVNEYPSNKGEILLNTLTLDDFPFNGHYYPENNIDLTVKPNEGEVFLYWENLRTGEKLLSQSIQVNPQYGDTLVAVFESETQFNLNVYPVPIQNQATLEFSLPQSSEVTISLYSLEGREIAQLNHDYLAKGSYAPRFDLSFLSPGSYLVVVRTPYGQETIPVVTLF